LFFIILPTPTSTLFPYTTLFRSLDARLNVQEIRDAIERSMTRLGRVEQRRGLDGDPSNSQRRLRCLCHERRNAYAESQRDLRERSEEHTSELQSLAYLVCRLLLE